MSSARSWPCYILIRLSTDVKFQSQSCTSLVSEPWEKQRALLVISLSCECIANALHWGKFSHQSHYSYCKPFSGLRHPEYWCMVLTMCSLNWTFQRNNRPFKNLCNADISYNIADVRRIILQLHFPIESADVIIQKYEEILKQNPEIKMVILGMYSFI